MNEYDKEILNKIKNQIAFKEFDIAVLKDKLKELEKELKALKTTKTKFEQTGILYC